MSVKAYGVSYSMKKGNITLEHLSTVIDAKDLNSARNKLARKHRVEAKDIKIKNYSIVGYY